MPLPASVTPDSLRKTEALVSRTIALRDERLSLVSRIASRIGAEIVLSIRAPSDDLNSVELARQYKTSRTPVREALMLLEKQGLVEVPPRRRPRVVLWSLTEIREMYLARAALFELIAHDTVAQASETDLAHLRRIITQMRRAARTAGSDEYVWAVSDFYDVNTEIARNQTVKRMLDSLLLRTFRSRRLSLSLEGRVQRSLDDHVRLVRAYEDRDANLAAALIRSNHIKGLAALQNHFGKGLDPRPVIPELAAGENPEPIPATMQKSRRG